MFGDGERTQIMRPLDSLSSSLGHSSLILGTGKNRRSYVCREKSLVLTSIRLVSGLHKKVSGR